MSLKRLCYHSGEEGDTEEDEYQMEFDRMPLSTKFSEISTMIQKSIRHFGIFFNCPSNVDLLINPQPLDVWMVQFSLIEPALKLVTNFTKTIIGFNDLPKNKLREAIDTGLFTVISAMSALSYNPHNDTVKWFHLSQRDLSMTITVLNNSKLMYQFIMQIGRRVHALHIDHVEMAFLCAIYLFDKGNYYEYKELFLDALAWFIENKGPKRTGQLPEMLSCLRLFYECDFFHKKLLLQFFTNPSFRHFPKPHYFSYYI